MDNWQRELRGDPLPWLLDPVNPEVRHMTLRLLLDRDERDEEVREARAESMRRGPVAAILMNQQPEGYWVKPGAGYSPKYTSTVWSVMFLDQLGADGSNSRIQRACEYVLSHSRAEGSGFGASGKLNGSPPRSSVIHCLNGNLLRALIGFGWLDDPRVQQALSWQARSITGEGFDGYFRSGTSGPGFACAANDCLPCGWGATKAVRGLARVPTSRRTPEVQRAIDFGVEFLIAGDPSSANYPTATRVSSSWFKPGFPSGYVADSLQVLEVLAELGHANDPRLSKTVDWVLSLQDAQGRWKNRYAYNKKMWLDIEKQGDISKWVTLRACYALKHAL